MKDTYYRGHKIEIINDIWIYSDNKKPVKEDKNRLCGRCNQPSAAEGHDACIGNLIGVMNACCGHGIANDAYVQFLDCHAVHGERAVKIIEELKDDNKVWISGSNKKCMSYIDNFQKGDKS